MRKAPRSGAEWEVVRLGADIGIRCPGCGRRVPSTFTVLAPGEKPARARPGRRAPALTQSTDRGFRQSCPAPPVLRAPGLRSSWRRRLSTQSHFIQLVLVEKLTSSAVQLGITILAFTVPGILFSPIAGVMADRLLLEVDFGRVERGAGCVCADLHRHPPGQLDGAWRLIAIYVLTFLTATTAQFLRQPKETSIRCWSAKSPVAGQLVVHPHHGGRLRVLGLAGVGAALHISLLRVEVVSRCWPGYTWLPRSRCRPCRRDRPARGGSATSGWRRVWTEMAEELAVRAWPTPHPGRDRQLVTIATMIMLMAMLAPGYAAHAGHVAEI